MFERRLSRPALPKTTPRAFATASVSFVRWLIGDTHDDNSDGGDAIDMFPLDMLKADIEMVKFAVDFTSYRA